MNNLDFTKTTIGRDLQELGYKDDLVKQVDDLFFRLYCMRLSERDEVAGVMKEYIDHWIGR